MDKFCIVKFILRYNSLVW